MRTLARTALIAIGCLATAVVFAEGLIRVWNPMPRIQIVRGPHLKTLDGVPYWEFSTDRQHLDCVETHPRAIRVLVLGDSILYGSSLADSEVFTTLLERRLSERFPDPGVCILNFSQPGFSGQQKVSLALRLIPKLRPALILWGIWGSELDSYVRFGDAAYNFSRIVSGADGLPNVLGISATWNAWLFERSRLYQYFTLSLAPFREYASPADLRNHFEGRMSDVFDAAREVGAGIVFAVCPALDRPFHETAASSGDPLKQYLVTHHLPVVDLAHELAGRDVVALRLDPCCHFNAEGHRAIADVLFPRVVNLLGLDRSGDQGL